MKTFFKITGYLLSLLLISSLLGTLISTFLSEDRTNVLIQLTVLSSGLMIIPGILLYLIFRIPSKLYDNRYYSRQTILDEINIEYKGLGSTFSGKSDIAKDGSFITTKWFSIIYFPVIPLQRFRVLQLNSHGIPFVYKKFRYKIIEFLPLDKIEIAKHYRIFYLILLPLLLIPAIIIALLPDSNAGSIVKPYMTNLAIGYICWACFILIVFSIFYTKNNAD